MTGSASEGVIRPLDIGGVRLAGNLILAPMSGVTDCAFRCMVRRASKDAVGLLVSEFVASEGLIRGNARTVAMLRLKELERPISIQIFGAEPAHMARAAVMAEAAGADIVDINCGCPAPKVVRRGGGAELMRQPELLRAILREVRRAVSIPMTVKIRSGWDDNSLNALDIALLAEDSGAAMVAVHGRTRLQLYRGDADWDLVARIRDRLSVPVAGSGDIEDLQAALSRLREGYADALMIGRAAIANPWIFAQLRALDSGLPPLEISPRERAAAVTQLRSDLLETRSERAMIGRYRGLTCRMVKGMPGGAALRRAIGEAASSAEVESIVRAFFLGKAAGTGELADVA